MRLSISNIGWKKEKDQEIFHWMKELGFTGLEIAPTRIIPEKPYEARDEAAAFGKSLAEDYGFVISSMQSIWNGRTEQLFGSAEERRILMDVTDQAMAFAEALGCGNLVFGCPRNRSLKSGADPETGKVFFRGAAALARSHRTVLSLEANPPIYNTNYINDTVQALELVRSVNDPGFRLNLDMGTMIANGEKARDIEGQGALIHHVHISEPYLKPLEKRSLHRELRSVLEAEGYDGFVSIEVGTQEDEREILRCMEYAAGVFL